MINMIVTNTAAVVKVYVADWWARIAIWERIWRGKY